MTTPSAQTMTELADKITRSYLFTLNKGGPTEKNLTGAEIDLLFAALRSAPVPQGVREALETARYVFEEFMPSGPLVNDALKKIKAALSAPPADGREALFGQCGYGVFWIEKGQPCSKLVSSETDGLNFAALLRISGASIEPIFRALASKPESGTK